MGEEQRLHPAKKDAAIEYIRVIAMLMIILCHLFQYYDNELAWWFNTGVQIFFVTSGFLYGTKEIEDPITFIGKQVKKILIPYYTFLIPVSILYFLFAPEHISVTLFIKALFCADLIQGIKHLWFIPYILFCYFITPYLYWFRKKVEGFTFVKMTGACLLLMGLYMALGLLFNSFFIPDRVVCYIFGFFLAVYYQKYGRKFINVLGWFFIPIGAIINAIRIYAKYFVEMVDGTKLDTLFSYYEHASHVLLGIALFLLMYIAFRKIRVVRAIQITSQYSYFVYIVHLLFLFPPFSLLDITTIPFLNILLAFLVIGMSAFLLKIISDKFGMLCKCEWRRRK